MEPCRRLGITHVVKQKRIIIEGDHFLHSRYFWNWDDGLVFAVQAEATDLGRAAQHVADIKRISCQNDLLDHRLAGRNDLNGFSQFRCVERKPEDFTPRRAGARKKIQRVIASQAGEFDLIAEVRDLVPAPTRSEQIMGKITAIAIRHGGENVPAVAGSLELDLCNPREVFANRVSVFSVTRAEFVKINLLIKIKIGVRPLALPGKTCVINA